MTLKEILIFCGAVALALVIGLAVPDITESRSLALFGGVAALFLFPFLLRYHSFITGMALASGLVVPFAPGKPELWVVMAFVTIGFAMFDRILKKRSTYLHVPEIVLPLVGFTLVVFVTMAARGGFGGQAFGSSLWGIRRYYALFGAAVLFFALSTLWVPMKQRRFFTGLFFGSGLLLVIPEIAFRLGGGANIVFLFFSETAVRGESLMTSSVDRFQGFSAAGTAVGIAILMLMGVKNLLTIQRIGIGVLLLATMVFSLLGGFRSTVLFFILLSGIIVCLERSYLQRRFIILLLVGVAVFFGMASFVRELPLSLQRAFSILPLDVDPQAAHDAGETSTWRWEVWKVAAREIPDYLLLGKGFGYSGEDQRWAQNLSMFAGNSGLDWALLGSWYHSGPLSLMLCLGLPGTIMFLWFIWSTGRFLRRNWLTSPPELRQVNLGIYALFLQRTIFFFTIYGQIDQDMVYFTSLAGLGVVLNRSAKPYVVAMLDRSPDRNMGAAVLPALAGRRTIKVEGDAA